MERISSIRRLLWADGNEVPVFAWNVTVLAADKDGLSTWFWTIPGDSCFCWSTKNQWWLGVQSLPVNQDLGGLPINFCRNEIDPNSSYVMVSWEVIWNNMKMWRPGNKDFFGIIMARASGKRFTEWMKWKSFDLFGVKLGSLFELAWNRCYIKLADWNEYSNNYITTNMYILNNKYTSQRFIREAENDDF